MAAASFKKPGVIDVKVASAGIGDVAIFGANTQNAGAID